MFNTPPTYSWYLAGLVFKWLKRHGGLEAMEARNIERGPVRYDYIDASDFYSNHVAKHYRSRMNVPFQLKNAELDAAFLAESKGGGSDGVEGTSYRWWHARQPLQCHASGRGEGTGGLYGALRQATGLTSCCGFY